ncbi:FadR/GntR family transcriptional regulator [Cellulosilyticum sp. I15G10I2]|uniref:FadR/GntR family transcriptional regulator n=1 Tax=Cellulosilyticum sp. I15G10I2 TaxID=1892843 RepID=UPI00085C9BF0|nr:FadR/GntR family transcriptional regulator [Cellulosilyticum sp. I15G10I2]
MDEKQSDTKGLAMMVAAEVKKSIIKSNMQPGTKLPSESELTLTFGMSRSTIREAMNLLKAENIVEIKRGKGTFVSSQTGMTKDPLGLDFINQPGLLEALLEARLLIEQEIAFLAALRAEEKDIEILEEIINKMNESKDHSEEFTLLDVEFHSAVAQCTHNDVLHKVIPIICESIRKAYPETVHSKGSFERALKSHVNIFNAIKARDVMKARYEVEKHIRQTLDDIKIMEGLHEKIISSINGVNT